MKKPPKSQGRIKSFVERIAASCGIKEVTAKRLKETAITVVPRTVLTVVGNNEPDEYEVTDTNDETWYFSINVVQESGEKLRASPHQPLELHFGDKGQIVKVIQQEYKEYKLEHVQL